MFIACIFQTILSLTMRSAASQSISIVYVLYIYGCPQNPLLGKRSQMIGNYKDAFQYGQAFSEK